MNELTPLYIRLLHCGLLSIREALYANDVEWAKAQAELLHNIPSLLDEPNVKRHEYFWFSERGAYLDWVNLSGSEQARKRMRIYYEPVWQEMEPILTELLSSARTATLP
jgi:hypothetical protein